MNGQKYGWMGGGRVKNEGAKKGLPKKPINIVSYALKVRVSVNSHIVCVCSPFQVIRHIRKLVNWLSS